MRFNAIYFLSLSLLLTALCGCKTPKLSEANEQMERGEFFNAAKTYRAVYNKLSPKNERELRGVVAYRLATCYRRLNQAPRASAAYQNAIRYEYPDSMAFYYLGRSLQAEGKYNPAIDAYTAFLEWRPDDALAKEGIRGCRKAIRAKGEPKSRYIVRNAKSSTLRDPTSHLCILTKL